MTELESKIWNMTHKWCDGVISEQNRRYLMDEIKALVSSNVTQSLPSKEVISHLAKDRALKFNYVNEIGYLRHIKSFELGAEFVIEHLKNKNKDALTSEK